MHRIVEASLNQGPPTLSEQKTSLYLSERIVKRKVQDVLDKLGATNRAQAVSEADKRGIL